MTNIKQPSTVSAHEQGYELTIQPSNRGFDAVVDTGYAKFIVFGETPEQAESNLIELMRRIIRSIN